MNSITIQNDQTNARQWLKATKILFENDTVCLCEASFAIIEENDGIGCIVVGIEDEVFTVLFSKETGNVLTENFQSWYASWYD